MRSFGRSHILVSLSLGASVLALSAMQPAFSVGSQGIGQRYNDGLDSRHSVTSFINAAKSIGYTGSAWTAGRSSTNAWSDAMGAAVVGYFGHANAGLFQVDDAATDATDQFIGAGFETDVASTDSRFRWWGEYLPFTDVDDVRLAVLAGCYTANADEIFGQFAEIGERKGIDSVVGFTDLVYYPGSTDLLGGLSACERKNACLVRENWTYQSSNLPEKKGISQMQLSHSRKVVSATFDDPNLVSAAGLVPVMKIAKDAGLHSLADEHLSVPTDKGANPGLKVASLVAGMVAGADSIDDMGLLRHGGMGRIFNNAYAPSTLGSFLREFTFGHVRQLDAIASRFLLNLDATTPLLGETCQSLVMVDVDDTIIEVHGYAKQGAAHGYSGVRGLNALIGTVSGPDFAPVICGGRLRKGNAGSPRGAARLITDVLTLVGRSSLTGRKVLFRADSAFRGHPTISAALKAGADVSVTLRLDPAVRAAITKIPDDAWTKIQYPNAVQDEETGKWISDAEVAEMPFIAFAAQKKAHHTPGRLIVRRVPEANPKTPAGQGTLFDTWRFHAFFTTTDPKTLNTVAADKTHRAHAIIEQVNADLKSGPLAHLPEVILSPRSASRSQTARRDHEAVFAEW